MHHAYFYEGALAELEALAESARKEFEFVSDNNPDVQVLEFEKFGIDEARELVRTAALKSISGRALYIVGVSSISTDAQQALLKLFEEPQEGSIFVLLAPHGSVIATLRSRMLPYPVKSSRSLTSGKTAKSDLARKFLASPYAARSAEIAKLLKDEDAVKERVRDFLGALEAELYKHVRPTRSNSKEILQGLEDIAKVRSYVGDRAPAMKMLLEHLAVTLPRFDLNARLPKVEP